MPATRRQNGLARGGDQETEDDEFVKSPEFVIPAEAGIYKSIKSLDSGLRRNDGKSRKSTFYETIKVRVERKSFYTDNYKNWKGGKRGIKIRKEFAGAEDIEYPNHYAASSSPRVWRSTRLV